VFPRSVRVGNYGTAEDQAKNVVAEMRRTIAAANNQIAGHLVQSVLILGSETEQRVLADIIARELELPVAFVDPLEAVTLSSGAQTPSNIGRFAPLVGALVDEARSRRHEIDFLSPRKRPEPPNRQRAYAVVGSVVAAALLLLIGFGWWQLSSLDSQANDLQQQSRKLDKSIKDLRPTVDKAKLIDDYAAGQVAWLDEFRELAADLPPGEKVILDELSIYAGPPRMEIVGGASSAQEVPSLEMALSDERHNVRGTGTVPLPQADNYSWSFREKIELVDPDKKPSASPLRRSAPSAKTAGGKS
jgi:hypothetical protein